MYRKHHVDENWRHWALNDMGSVPEITTINFIAVGLLGKWLGLKALGLM